MGTYLGTKIILGPGETTSSLEKRLTDFTTQASSYSLASISCTAAFVSATRIHQIGTVLRVLSQSGRDQVLHYRPFLIRRVVTRAIVTRSLPDSATGVLSPRGLLDLEAAEFNITDVAERLDDSPATVMMRLYQSQYHDQLGIHYFIAELSLILKTVDRLRQLSGIDINDAFQQRNGLSFRDFAFLSFGFFALASAHPGSTWGAGEPALVEPLNVAPGAIEAYKQLTSLTYEEFAERAREVAFPDYPTYSLSPLLMWPFIRLPDHSVVLPVATDALDRAVKAVFYDNLSCLTRDQFNRFLTEYGSVYEQFVYDTLCKRFGTASVYRAEDAVTQIPNRGICDVIVDGGAYGLLLVEVKSGRLPARASLLKTPNEMRAAFAQENSGASKGLKQLDDTRHSIQDGESDFVSSRPCFGLLVLYGETVFLNSTEVRGYIEDGLTAQPAIRYQVANDLGFTTAVASATTADDFVKMIRMKHSSNQTREVDFQLDATVAPQGLALHDEYSSMFDNLMSAYGVSETTAQIVEADFRDD